MARIPKYELEYLKKNLSLLSLVQSQGHKLKRQGPDSYVCLCPFYTEKTPSCAITPSREQWHCFGCGASGSVIDWQMKSTGQSLREAVQFLKARLV
ncbi:MAG TPA: CHC2 zinc finger domain-containing protein [Klebsiella sp.]|jgi:DNA primase